MEPRCLLAAGVLPLQIGAVYYEDASGQDEAGDLFEVTFDGGVAGTQLAQLAVQTDKTGDGLTIGDVFFDPEPGGLGAFGAVPLQIVQQTGIDSVNASVDDGGTSLVFTFTGFDPGDRLIFSIDVDEQGFLGPNAVAEGNELEGSQLIATLTAPHYFDAIDSDIFIDYFQQKLDDSGLRLPPDDFVPPGAIPTPVRTAAAIFPVSQTPLPITIAGTVFEDLDLDNTQDLGEPGLRNVDLTLMELQGTQYVATGQTAVTKADGSYLFENILPGTYRVVETQPAGLFSVGAKAGSVGTQQRGVVANADVITGIALLGGEHSSGNDFAEARPAALSGNVYHDADNDGLRDPGETGIAGAVIRVQYLPPAGPAPAPIEAITAPNGSWSVANLMPGNYYIAEVQPGGYFDGLDAAGTAGGTAHNPGDKIDGIRLLSGASGRHYNFGELLPNSVSGRVTVDTNANGRYDPGETPLSDVTVLLRETPGGTPVVTYTDVQGRYEFTGLGPGTYTVEEVQPKGYFDGADQVGSEGGALLPPDSIVDIRLISGTAAVGYDFSELAPNSISGRVTVDANGNGTYDPGETPLSDVTVLLHGTPGGTPVITHTDAQGRYEFTGLEMGTYIVEEVQPKGYFDGADQVGSEGGALLPPDSIADIRLVSGTAAVGYDFSELESVSIGGFVYVDENGNGVRSADEPGIGGVKLTLLDAQGKPTDATAVTDAAGRYGFANLIPNHVYGVAEAQPSAFKDGLDAAGTAGGKAHNPGDRITGAVLSAGRHAKNYNFGELRPYVPPPSPPPLPPPPPPSPPPLPPPPPPFVPPIQTAPPVVYRVVPPEPTLLLPLYGGGWLGSAANTWQTWHLSVVDGGQPRRDSDTDTGERIAEAGGVQIYPAKWMEVEAQESYWILADTNGEQAQRFQFGLTGGTPVAGDWNGDGSAEIGVFLDGLWYLDLNGNGDWEEGDLWIRLGTVADTPVVGDWDGDGKTDIGVFGPSWPGDARAVAAEPGLPDMANASTGRYKNIPPEPKEATVGWRTMKRTSEGNLRADVVDHVFEYGTQGDVAVAGDWNGDGVSNIGLFRRGSWYLDADGNGRWNAGDIYVESFGKIGDLPVVGDFNGDGIDDLGVYRGGTWYLDANGDRALTAHDKVFQLGGPYDKPAVGDFNGDGTDEVAICRDNAAATDAQAGDAPTIRTQEVATSQSRPPGR